MTAPFYKVVTHSLSAYGGQDKAAARAMFEHQKKLIEQGQTQAHEVTLLEDNEAIDRYTLEEEFQEVEDTPLEKALKIAAALNPDTPDYMGGVCAMIAKLYPNEETFEDRASSICLEINDRIDKAIKEKANEKAS